MRGKGDRFADVVQAAQPGDSAFQAQAEAGVGDAAVAAQVDEPAEDLGGQAVGLDGLLEGGEVVLALAAADDLAIAFRRDHVDAQGQLGVLGSALHVKGLDGGGG